MIMKKNIITLFAALVICSCSNSSSNNNTYKPDRDKYEQKDSYSDNELDDDDNIDNDEQMYACPMCGGTGIFEVMPGDVMAPKQICQGCGGNKFVTAEQAQNIMEAKRQVDALMGRSNDTGGGGRSAYEIEYDLKKAYDLLNGMEYDYQHCSSGVMKAQYPSMIADQKALIRQLENELRNAQ